MFTATWNGGPGDFGSADWTFDAPPPAGVVFPSNTGTDHFNVHIDGGKAAVSAVALSGIGVAVDSLQVNAADSLTVTDGFLSMVQDPGRPASGLVDNAGLIGVTATGANFSSIGFSGDVTFQGGGRLILSGPAVDKVFEPDQDPDTLRSRSGIFAQTVSDSLTNQNHTIEGSGAIFGGRLRNLSGGVIDANQANAALVLSGTDATLPGGFGLTNSGTMRASDGGILRLFFGTYVQNEGGASGVTEALAGSTVHIENSGVTVNGGQLRTVDDGRLLLRTANVTLNDVAFANAGRTDISNSLLTVTGGGIGNSGSLLAQDTFALLDNIVVNNSGVMELAATGANFSSIGFSGDVTFQGGGRLILSGPAVDKVFEPDQDPDTLQSRSGIFGQAPSARLTNQNHTIEGSGRIFNGQVRNLSGGVIDANQAGAALALFGQDLTLPGGFGLTNSGTMRASDGGILRLFFGTYVQNEGGASGVTEALAGSTVHIENSGVTVNGGQLRTVDDGRLLLRTANVTLNDVAFANAGTLLAQDSFVALNNMVVNNSGVMELAATGANFSSIGFSGDVTLQGGGRLILSGPAVEKVFEPDQDPDTVRSRSAIFAQTPSDSLTNRNHTIEGSGAIFGGRLRNLSGGVIDANQAGAALVLFGQDATGGFGLTNSGTMRASDGGILRLFFGTYVQNDGGASGVTEALAGSTVHIENSGVTVNGGQLRTVDDGRLLLRNSTVTLNDVAFANAGRLDISNSLLTVTGGGLVNSGDVAIAKSSVIADGAYIQTGGRTLLDNGLLQAGSIDIQAGILQGNGTVIGPTGVNGTLMAGLSAGILNFLSASTFAGSIEIEIGSLLVDGALPDPDAINVGTDPLSTGFDQYHVFATAVLLSGLTFDISLLGGFLPRAGSFFDVFTADELIADLATLEFEFADSAIPWDVRIVSIGGREALRLFVVSEPGTLALLLAGLIGLRIRARR